jgi:hypothetical protein
LYLFFYQPYIFIYNILYILKILYYKYQNKTIKNIHHYIYNA